MKSTSDPAGVFVGLGSNLGDRLATLEAALHELDRVSGVRVRAVSAFHETQPVGGPPGQPPFLNAVAELATKLPPLALLTVLQEIELRHGRQRGLLNGPRTLDLDLLLYRDEVIESPTLRVPHPRMWSREFVLVPLAELCNVAALRRRFNAG